MLDNVVSLESERLQFLSSHQTLRSILADLIDAVVWMNSIRPPIPNSSGPFSKPLENVPSAPIRVGITTALMFDRLL